MTTITITDPALLAQIAVAGTVEVKDADGRVVATLFREGYGKLPSGVKSPISDEEFERARQEPSRPVTMAEVWERIHQKYGRS